MVYFITYIIIGIIITSISESISKRQVKLTYFDRCVLILIWPYLCVLIIKKL